MVQYGPQTEMQQIVALRSFVYIHNCMQEGPYSRLIGFVVSSRMFLLRLFRNHSDSTNYRKPTWSHSCIYKVRASRLYPHFNQESGWAHQEKRIERSIDNLIQTHNQLNQRY